MELPLLVGQNWRGKPKKNSPKNVLQVLENNMTKTTAWEKKKLKIKYGKRQQQNSSALVPRKRCDIG